MEKMKTGVYSGGRMINHRPLLKVWANNFLRMAQFWTKNKYIIASCFDTTYQGGVMIKDELTGYTLTKMKHKHYLPRRYNKELALKNSYYT